MYRRNLHQRELLIDQQPLGQFSSNLAHACSSPGKNFMQCHEIWTNQRHHITESMFLCQQTCQSADIMSSLCGVGECVRVCVNNFSSKTKRPRDMLFSLKDTLSIEDEKLFKACKSVCLLKHPHQKCENFSTLSQFSQ